MSYDFYDDDYDVGYERLLEELSEETAKYALGTTGDAIDARVASCLREAEELLASSHPGPALSLAATAGELVIRFLIVRPLVQAAFFSEEWASIIASRIGTGRGSDDRELLPKVLKQWGIDITAFKTDSGVPIWDFMRSRLWPERDNFIHKGDRPSMETATLAIECIRCFRDSVVNRIASKLGFTLTETGKWAEVAGKDVFGHKQPSRTYQPWDPVPGKPPSS